MKFKAIITDPACMRDFNNLIGTFARLTKDAAMNIKADGLTILNDGDAVHGIPRIWITIEHVDFFSVYAMEGVDEEHNEICLSLNPSKLAGALGTLKGTVNSVRIKLTKKQFPCLTVEIQVPSESSGNTRLIVHDVPVNLIPVRDWREYQTPKLPPFQMTVSMPTIKSLRALSDKMKNLAPSLTVCFGINGDLSFIVETDYAVVASRYYDLMVQQLDKENTASANDGDGDEVACRIDTKQLALCFASNQFQNIEMTGNIIQDEVFNVLFVIRRNVTMNCAIYAVCGAE